MIKRRDKPIDILTDNKLHAIAKGIKKVERIVDFARAVFFVGKGFNALMIKGSRNFFPGIETNPEGKMNASILKINSVFTSHKDQVLIIGTVQHHAPINARPARLI